MRVKLVFTLKQICSFWLHNKFGILHFMNTYNFLSVCDDTIHPKQQHFIFDFKALKFYLPEAQECTDQHKKMSITDKFHTYCVFIDLVTVEIYYENPYSCS